MDDGHTQEIAAEDLYNPPGTEPGLRDAEVFSIFGICFAQHPVRISEQETIYEPEKFVEYALNRIAGFHGKEPTDGGMTRRELWDRMEACGIQSPLNEESK